MQHSLLKQLVQHSDSFTPCDIFQFSRGLVVAWNLLQSFFRTLRRLCGTPRLTLDLTASHSKWQIVAYLFGVNRRTKVGSVFFDRSNGDSGGINKPISMI